MHADAVCHMLIGPPGSGKTTLAHKMQQAIANSCVISTDQIRNALYGDEAQQGQWPEIEAVVQQQMQNALALGQSIIYDATNAKRHWRMGLLQKLAELNPIWVGWHLTTDLKTCQQWNAHRDRAVPAAVIEGMYTDLQQFAPQPAEGFAAIYSIDPAEGIGDIQAKLSTLSRGMTNRANRTRHSEIQLHRYSALLDFDRLMHLISLLVQQPGLGHFHQHDPDHLRDLLGGKPALTSDLPSAPVDEICAVIAQQRGSLYAAPDAIAQDLAWLEQNGFLSPTPTDAVLTRPPSHHAMVNPHAYTDWDACKRVLTTIRFMAHHPFCWDPEQAALVC